MAKTVFLEGRLPNAPLHSLYKPMLNFPPEGYKIVTHKKEQDLLGIDIIHRIDRRLISAKSHVFKTFGDVLIPGLYYTYLFSRPFKRPKNTDLVYSSQHIIVDRTPWVVDLEHIGAIFAYGRIEPYRSLIAKYLSSKFCKKIIPWSDAGKRTLFLVFNQKNIRNKVETVYLAVPPKKTLKREKTGIIQLLFVGTSNPWNIEGSFDLKGGKEVLLAFTELAKKYPNIKLVIRSFVPVGIKKKYARVKNLKIIDQVIPVESLHKLYSSSDIFLFPGHQTPGMVILEAMSFGLPVITTDLWANKEMVKDGVNGFLIRKSSRVPYFNRYFIPKGGTSDILEAITEVDKEMVRELIEKASILIEDRDLRHKMSIAARREIETGKFSIKKRNEKLKKIFDESTAY